MHILDLPVETTDAVVDQLAAEPDRPALRALALAHSRVSYRARRHLHREARITTKSAKDIRAVYLGIKDFVNILHIELGLPADGDSENRTEVLLDWNVSWKWQAIKEIRIDKTAIPIRVESKRDYGVFDWQDKTVETFRLSNVWFEHFDDFASLIFPLPKLRDLYIDNIKVKHFFDPSRKCWAPRRSIRNVYITGEWNLFTLYAMDWFQKYKKRKEQGKGGANIRTVQIPYPLIRDPTQFANFMDVVSDTLTHLTIDYYSRDMGCIGGAAHLSIGLSALPKLESLTLKCVPLPKSDLIQFFHGSPMQWMANVLGEVDSTSLREVRFHCHLVFPIDMKSFPFKDVQTILSTQQFPKLESITFHIPSRSPLYCRSVLPAETYVSNIIRIIQEGLPNLWGKGVIQVVDSEDEVHMDVYYGSHRVGGADNITESFIHRDIFIGDLMLNVQV